MFPDYFVQRCSRPFNRSVFIRSFGIVLPRMFSENELLAYLTSRFTARAVILYGSAVSGGLTSSSDIDVVCFVDSDERYPELGRWQGLLLDIWVHPLKDAESVDDFLKLHDGHVLLDHNDIAKTLVERVSERLSKRPTPLDTQHIRHRKAWIWKMFDRACLRRHRRGSPTPLASSRPSANVVRNHAASLPGTRLRIQNDEGRV